MSLSEIFDQGGPHVWANLRINNLTVDGTISGAGISGSFIITYNSAVAVSTAVCYFTKFNNAVTISFGRLAGNYNGGTAILAAAGSIPANLAPLSSENFAIPSTNSPAGNIGSNNLGRLTIFTDGSLTYQRDMEGTSWGPAGNVVGSLTNFTVTYLIRP